MITSPTLNPQQFGFKQGDHHLVINAATKTAKAYSYSGQLIWERPALADGQHANWRVARGDTPPGLYKIGQYWLDLNNPPDLRTRMSYGWLTLDLVDLEGNEDRNNRAGICIHGGGSGLGQVGSWEPIQRLLPTWGCVRMHNRDLVDLLLPLVKKGTVFVSVHQDDA
jgi:hypothetical protein